MQRRQLPNDPYVLNAVKLKQLAVDDFRSTYTDSYKNLRTDKCSPLITEYREFFNNEVDPTLDQSPYPLARYAKEPIVNKPYRTVPETPGQRPPPPMMDPHNQTRYEKSTLKRDPYMEQLPPRGYIEREKDFPMTDPRDELHQYQRDPTPQMPPQGYDEMRADGPQQEPKRVFCNKCFKSDCCMNKLSCPHMFCDDCMATIPCQDRQFRDSIRWHYCCEICNKLTSDPKLVRVDPWGQRLEDRYAQVEVPRCEYIRPY